MKKKEKQIKQPKQEKKGFQFADWDYDTISGSIPNLPASWIGFWAWRIKRIFLGLKLSKSAFLLLLKALLAFVAVSAASYYFNIFFWAWLNDSMWIGWGKGYGNVAGFLIPGGAFNTGNGIIGLEPLAVFLNLFFKQGSNYSVPNGLLAWPFTLAVGCLVTYLISNILTRGLTGVLRDVAGIPVYLHHYAGRGSKKLWKFLLEGVFYATVIGFVVVNPFAVPLLGVYILLCFGQEADNPRVIGLFLRRCRLYKKAEKGGGKAGEKPLLADTMLQIFSLGLGFFVYSLLNLLVWNLFAYHFFARLIFSLLLAAMTLTLSGGARRKKLGKAMGMMAITTGVLALSHVTAFAHDGGASESGGTWTGLTRNAGFKDMDASSKLGVAGMNIGAAHATRLVNYADILMDSKTRLTATDQFILDRMFNMYDRYYRGEPVSMDEFNSLRDLYIKNLNGQLSDDVNYQRTWAQGFWEDTGTAFSNGFRELVEGQTVNSAIARVPLGVATMGYSEMAIAPFGAAYDAYSRVQSGNTNAWSVWSGTMGNQIFNLAVGEACGAGGGQRLRRDVQRDGRGLRRGAQPPVQLRPVDGLGQQQHLPLHRLLCELGIPRRARHGGHPLPDGAICQRLRQPAVLLPVLGPRRGERDERDGQQRRGHRRHRRGGAGHLLLVPGKRRLFRRHIWRLFRWQLFRRQLFRRRQRRHPLGGAAAVRR